MTDDTLTLRATGPAEASLETDHDGVPIATTTERQLDAELDFNAAAFQKLGAANTRGAFLRPDAVADLVCETRSGSDGDFAPQEGWTLELSGSFAAYGQLAYEIADDVLRTDARDKTANVMCHVLDALAEYAVDDRPRLVMLDICDSYDPADYSRQKLLSALADAPESMPDATPPAEAMADD
ncbi:hypothetical protein [Halobellus ordinarius]|uniref:hypothetical protein n=1 Tax=Halobellus ordinarius TaxID=3075120 RepID=UPI0028809119|nr:hypothetical protein [Halobellus sp. ZY16]